MVNTGDEAVFQFYYMDSDGDGYGFGSPGAYCSASVPTGWVLNNTDPEPNCFSNDTDDCGVCSGNNSSCTDCAGTPNGSAYLDNCNTCDNDSSNDCTQDCAGNWGGAAYYGTYYLDVDGDGLGTGDAYILCNGLNLTGWVTNNNDTDDNCTSNIHDCAGVCNGSSLLDDCGVCDGGNTDQDCAGICGGSAYVDNCNTCDNDSSNDISLNHN